MSSDDPQLNAEPCPNCQGKGRKGMLTCRRCEGRGRLPLTLAQTIELTRQEIMRVFHHPKKC